MSQFLHIQDGSGGRPIGVPGEFASVRSMLKRCFEAAAGRAGNTDAGVGLKQFETEVARRIDAWFAKPERADGERIDATAAPGGTLGVGALRVVLGPAMAETRPLPSAFDLFSTDSTSVPLGKNEIEASRFWIRGDVKVWGGSGTEIPTIGRSQATRTWKVRYYITSVMGDVFEDMVSNAAGVNTWAELLRGVMLVMEEFANLQTWYGDDTHGLLGVLNYPWFNRISLNGPSGKAWSIDEDLSGIVTNEYVMELVRFVTHAWTVSKTAFRPNRMIIGQKMANFLKATKVAHSTTQIGDPPTLMEDFLRRQTIITSEAQIAIAQELDDAFDATNGISCIVLDRKDPMVIANILPGAGSQMLPLVKEGFVYTQPVFMAHGGIVSRKAGEVTIGYVETTAS